MARTASLFLVLTLLFVGIGAVLGYFMFDGTQDSMITIMAAFLIIAVVINMFTYFFSKKIVLRAHKVKLIQRENNPRLYNIVETIAMQAGLPMPQVGITNTPTPNAFATGRGPRNAAVVATTGLLELLNDDELRGVMAHELAHVKNRDILVMSIAATIAGAISIVAKFAFWSSLWRSRDMASLAIGILIYLTLPIAAMIIQLGISRNREYKADETGAKMINNPLALASALNKLEKGNIARPMAGENPSSAHMWIASPLGGKKGSKMFSTHPPIEERIRRLNKMAGRDY